MRPRAAPAPHVINGCEAATSTPSAIKDQPQNLNIRNFINRKQKKPIARKIKPQNANLWSFQTKDPHKHCTETWGHPKNPKFNRNQNQANEMTKIIEGITKQTNGMSYVIQLYIGKSNLQMARSLFFSFPFILLVKLYFGEREREKFYQGLVKMSVRGRTDLGKTGFCSINCWIDPFVEGLVVKLGLGNSVINKRRRLNKGLRIVGFGVVVGSWVCVRFRRFCHRCHCQRNFLMQFLLFRVILLNLTTFCVILLLLLVSVLTGNWF